MRLVIDIPDEAVKTDNIVNDFITYFECCTPKLFETLKNGTPLPKNHGRLIDAMKLKTSIFSLTITNSAFDRGLDAAVECINNAPTIIEEVNADEPQ